MLELNLKLQHLGLASEISAKKKCKEDVELVKESHLASANLFSDNYKDTF